MADELYSIFGDAKDIENIRNKLELHAKHAEEKCGHEKSFDVDGTSVCSLCGCEIETLNFDPEWRYYGAADTRSGGDPSRCHRSKESTRGGIEKVFSEAKVALPLAIRKKTEQRYKKVVNGRTVRGKGRKSIVAACLLYVLRKEGDVRSSDEVRKLFDLSKQEMSNGLELYSAVFPDDRVLHITPSDLIKRVLHVAKISFSHYKYVLRIAQLLEGSDPVLNRSNPSSVAAAIVYLYISITPELRDHSGYNKSKFARQMDLSDITITKLAKKAAEIIGIENIETF